MPTPRVFYDSPPGNLTSWSTNNFTVCTSEAGQSCVNATSGKYRGDLKSFEKLTEDFCKFHMFYGGFDAKAVSCESDNIDKHCDRLGVYNLCKPFE